MLDAEDACWTAGAKVGGNKWRVCQEARVYSAVRAWRCAVALSMLSLSLALALRDESSVKWCCCSVSTRRFVASASVAAQVCSQSVRWQGPQTVGRWRDRAGWAVQAAFMLVRVLRCFVPEQGERRRRIECEQAKT